MPIQNVIILSLGIHQIIFFVKISKLALVSFNKLRKNELTQEPFFVYKETKENY